MPRRHRLLTKHGLASRATAFVPAARKPGRSKRCARSRDAVDPTAQALVMLLDAERGTAQVECPSLVSEFDPDQVLLLWFAVGASSAMSRVVDRPSDSSHEEILEHALGTVLEGSGCQTDSSLDRCTDRDCRVYELFENAGRQAVQACLVGEARLSYYLDALSRYAESQVVRRVS